MDEAVSLWPENTKIQQARQEKTAVQHQFMLLKLRQAQGAAMLLNGNREVSSLAFRLTDCFGKTVDTKGHHISFSIIFLEDE